MIEESLTNIVLYDTSCSKQKLGSWFAHFRTLTDTENIEIPDSLTVALTKIKEEINNRNGDCPETFMQLLRDWSNSIKCATATNTPLIGRMYHSLYRQLFSTIDWFEPIVITDEEQFNDQFYKYRAYVADKYSHSMAARNIPPYIVPGSQPYSGLPTCLYVVEGKRTAGLHRAKHNRKNLHNLYDLSKHLLEGYNKEMTNGFHKRQAGKDWQQRELKQLKKYWNKNNKETLPIEFKQMVISLKSSPDDPITGFAFFRKNREKFLKRINPAVRTKDDSVLMKKADVDGFLKKFQDLKDISLDKLFN